MLAAAGQGLLDALAQHRDISQKVREVARLPQLDVEQLLQRYAQDAPAFYLLPGSFRTEDDGMVLTMPIAGVVRNVGGAERAFAGDGIDLGLDHLLTLAIRALHWHRIAGVDWRVVRGEIVDDPIFDKAGVAAIELTLESSLLALDADWPIEDLASFRTFHADVDLAPLAGELEYQSWLQEPPAYPTSRPDATVDVSLEGA